MFDLNYKGQWGYGLVVSLAETNEVLTRSIRTKDRWRGSIEPWNWSEEAAGEEGVEFVFGIEANRSFVREADKILQTLECKRKVGSVQRTSSRKWCESGATKT